MPTKKKNSKSASNQKYKAALIPVLLLVFGYVMWNNFTDDSPTETSSNRSNQSAKSDSDVELVRRKRNNAKTWPKTDVSFLDGPNPLASYRKFKPVEVVKASAPSESKVKQPEKQIEPAIQVVGRQLANRPVKYRFKSSGQHVLMIGDHVLKEGEIVSDDIRLDRIENGKLILKTENNRNLINRIN